MSRSASRVLRISRKAPLSAVVTAGSVSSVSIDTMVMPCVCSRVCSSWTCCRNRNALMPTAVATISPIASKLSLVCRPMLTGGALSGETVSAFRGEVYLAIAPLLVRRGTRVGREFRSTQYACASRRRRRHHRQMLLAAPPRRGRWRRVLGDRHRDLADPPLPLAGAGLVDRGSRRVDRHRHRHVPDLELVDRFHAEVGECDHARGLYRLGHEIGGAADRHEVRRAVLLDRLDGRRATLTFTDH